MKHCRQHLEERLGLERRRFAHERLDLSRVGGRRGGVQGSLGRVRRFRLRARVGTPSLRLRPPTLPGAWDGKSSHGGGQRCRAVIAKPTRSPLSPRAAWASIGSAVRLRAHAGRIPRSGREGVPAGPGRGRAVGRALVEQVEPVDGAAGVVREGAVCDRRPGGPRPTPRAGYLVGPRVKACVLSRHVA